MMKCVLGLVLLLHLCHSVDVKSVYEEIIEGLGKLNDLHTRKANITLPQGVRVLSSSNSCVGVCIQDLKQLLSNVTVAEEKRYILTKLNASLDTLVSLAEVSKNVDGCKVSRRMSLKPFEKYTHFFKHLYSKLR